MHFPCTVFIPHDLWHAIVCVSDLFCLGTFVLTNFLLYPLSYTNFWRRLYPIRFLRLRTFSRYVLYPMRYFGIRLVRLRTFVITNIIPYELYPIRSFGMRTFSYEHLAYEDYPHDLLSGHRVSQFLYSLCAAIFLLKSGVGGYGRKEMILKFMVLCSGIFRNCGKRTRTCFEERNLVCLVWAAYGRVSMLSYKTNSSSLPLMSACINAKNCVLT